MADKNIVYDIPPNYVSIAMLKEKWIKEQERNKKDRGEQQDQLQGPEPETLAQAGESIVVETEDTEIQAAKKKKKKQKKYKDKGKKKKGEDNVEVAGGEAHAPLISEGKNGPAAKPGEVRPKRKIVPKQSDRGGQVVKRNHAEKEKGSGVGYVKKVIPSKTTRKREIVEERRDRVDIAQKAGDLKKKVIPSEIMPNREIVPKRSDRVEDIVQKVGDLEKHVIPSEIMPNREIVSERSDRMEDIAHKVGGLSVNDYRERRLRRPTVEHRGSRGYQKKTDVQTIWVRKGEATGGGGVDGKGAE